MAGKNVIRQDVIQIDIDSNSMLSSFEKIQADIDKLKKTFGGMDNDLKDLKDSIGGIGDKSPFSKINTEAEKMKKTTGKANDEAEKLKSTFGDIARTSFSKVTSGIKNMGVAAGKAALKATTAGVGAAAAGVGAIVGSAVNSFGDYEQLVGGVETLFGTGGAENIEEYAKSVGKSVSDVRKQYKILKESEAEVIKNANDAYNTAGLSANEYMETVTGFSASLLQSVNGDTKKAAGIADTAIRDMSDNANKMGTDMSSIQYAYQGFAKQNYTMLDNLKLGYGGTKEEMQRLLKDAGKIEKKVFKLSSYADVIEAIHVMQENIGITGTTANEASSTIQGSLSAVKSTWANLMTSLVTGGASFDQCIDNFVKSAATFGRNIFPKIKAALEGVGYAIQAFAPVIEEKLPLIIEDLLPPLIDAATLLFRSFIKALPGIAKVIVRELPEVVSQIGQAIAETFSGSFVGKAGEMFSDNAAGFAKMIPLVAGGIFIFKQLGGVFNTLGSLTKSVGKGAGEVSRNSSGIFGSIAKADIKTTLRGMSNIAIIIGGFTAIAAALMAVSPYISKLSDTKSILKLAGVITVLGVIGTGLSFLSGIIGRIPAGTVTKGLINMGIMLGGLTGIYAVIAFVESKMNTDPAKILQIAGVMTVLGVVGTAMSVFAGIIGVIPMPVIITGLANMAVALGGLTAVAAAFGEIAKIPHLEELISSGGDLIAGLFEQIGKIGSSFVSGIGEGLTSALPQIGQNLSSFASSVKPMFDMFKSADMKGIGEFFKNLGSFMLEITGNKIADKIASWVSGETSLADLGTELTNFASNAQGFMNNSKSLSDTGNVLSAFAASTKAFFNQINSLDLKNLTGLWNVLKEMGRTSVENIGKMVDDSINTIVSKVGELPKKMGDAISNSGASLKDAVVKIWKDAVSASAAPVNKLLDGANFILTQFGSTARVAKWTPYARGTEGHKGGNALVNDGRGAELIQMPGGKTFIPEGRNVLLPDAPKGMKVLSAEDTAKVMGRKSPTFRYAKGNADPEDFSSGSTGGIDVWSFIDNSRGLVDAVKEKYVSYDGITGIALKLGRSMVNKISEAMKPWAEKLMDELGALSLAGYNPSKGVEQWRTTAITALKMEGQYSDENLRRLLYQMQTESGGDPKAINLWDSNAKLGTPSKGLMQVIDPTFKAYAREGHNTNIYDPLSNILASIRYAVSRYGSLAKAYRGVGYANGGIADKPSIFGENGAEMAIPLSLSKRSRALGLWEQTGDILGAYTPENSVSYGQSYNNDYNFSINITVDGSGSDTAVAGRIKQAVKDGINEMMNSFVNNNRPVREY